MKEIPDEIRDILASMEINGQVLTRCSRQLDRPTYDSLNKVLVALGGKWNRKANGHIFQDDPAEIIEQVLQTGMYTNAKQDYGMFYTPSALAESIVNDAICVHGFSFRGADILEPSAGRGAFVDVLVEKGANVYAAEIDPRNREILMQKNINLYTEPDFLKISPKILFDGIFMNPPFARQADIDHVSHALEYLKVGGMLFAIMSASVSFRTDRKTKAFRDMLDQYDHSVDSLPGGSFKESGTNVNAVLVTVTEVD